MNYAKSWLGDIDSGKCGFLKKGHEIMVIFWEGHWRSKIQCRSIGSACKDDGLVPRSGLSLVAKDYIHQMNRECHPKSADLPVKKLGDSCRYLDPAWVLNITDSKRDRKSGCAFGIFCLDHLSYRELGGDRSAPEQSVPFVLLALPETKSNTRWICQ
jgi:hypothetical protein